MTVFQCTDCGWIGTENQLNDVCVFHETRLEPAEYLCYCPDCGDNWENMEEVIEV